MDAKTARDFVLDLRVKGKKDSICENPWKDKNHIATDCFCPGVIQKLSRDPQLKEDHSVTLIEIFLTEELPDIDEFYGIFEVDEVGIWYYDGDGEIKNPVWRQRVIPWQYVKGLTIHQTS